VAYDPLLFPVNLNDEYHWGGAVAQIQFVKGLEGCIRRFARTLPLGGDDGEGAALTALPDIDVAELEITWLLQFMPRAVWVLEGERHAKPTLDGRCDMGFGIRLMGYAP
jgi:hypothetical protein